MRGGGFVAEHIPAEVPPEPLTEFETHDSQSYAHILLCVGMSFAPFCLVDEQDEPKPPSGDSQA